MAVSSKNTYPKAIPLHSPEELATNNNRLSQWNEELTAQTKRLKEWKDELEKRAARLRRWNVRLGGACAIVLLLASGAIWFAFSQARGIPNPAFVDDAQVPSSPSGAIASASLGTLKPGTAAQPETMPIHAVKAPTILPGDAIAKPDGGLMPDAQAKAQKANFLEALGGLSATHLYQSHLNIGLLADGVESETYTIEDAEKNLKSVVELMKHVEAQHARLVKSGLDSDDQDSIRQIQAVSAMLHLQIDSLRAYWATEDVEQANQYHLARKASWQGLTKVLGLEK